jgi:hypothetical protein
MTRLLTAILFSACLCFSQAKPEASVQIQKYEPTERARVFKATVLWECSVPNAQLWVSDPQAGISKKISSTQFEPAVLYMDENVNYMFYILHPPEKGSGPIYTVTLGINIIRCSPSAVTASVNGDPLVFTAQGGVAPYSWSVSLVPNKKIGTGKELKFAFMTRGIFVVNVTDSHGNTASCRASIR